ncbi:hypothetical protein G6O67_005962 [Ophiocordyceps sinensis]|uniref:Glutamyl/glutaminyl-tRNA synthetase class Ib catalytic domain-containing protein n=1 Tax=Ophiocordyceps sinensis TaxID=72228 RepID=A0A8H4PNP8_9HYPO|nr:hypothetical protein G6O67_005962 [Ophiocordyceps sinensis]
MTLSYNLCALISEGNAVGPERLSSIKWISKRASLAGKNFSQLDKALAELDLHLTLRTYIVGFRLDPADLAVWATLRANHIALSIVKNTYKNVLRWYEHAKAALLNDYFAHQKPGGTLICRFDDTNPSNESMEFQDAIVDDLKLMGIVPDKTSFSSDYFQLMYDYAIQLIEDGKAFADDSELGKGDEDRRNRLPSKRRHLGIDETLARFRDMKTGSDEGQRWCLRARIAYDSPNGTCVIPSYTGAT